MAPTCWSLCRRDLGNARPIPSVSGCILSMRRYNARMYAPLAISSSVSTRQLRIRLGRRLVTVLQDQRICQPVVVSFGMGTDSMAMLIVLRNLGIRPDLVLFADTGGEKPGTYAYLEVVNRWCAANGFPQITVVHLRSKHASLEDNALKNFTLPSLAYGRKGCSLKWKVAPMDTYVNSWEPAARARAFRMPVIRVIGYDAGPADSRRSDIAATDRWTYWYPLREAGLVREDCMALIEREGLPQPGKSACFFCPATRKPELLSLLDHHPDLVARALKIEAHASTRGYSRSTKGLGRTWNWRSFLAHARPVQLAQLAATEDIGQNLLPLTGDRQTTIAEVEVDQVPECVSGARVNLALSAVGSHWFTVPQIAHALRLNHREAAALVVRGVAERTWSSEYLDDQGFRVPVFRPATGVLSDVVAA